jgi:hypothetical protein
MASVRDHLQACIGAFGHALRFVEGHRALAHVLHTQRFGCFNLQIGVPCIRQPWWCCILCCNRLPSLQLGVPESAHCQTDFRLDIVSQVLMSHSPLSRATAKFSQAVGFPKCLFLD